MTLQNVAVITGDINGSSKMKEAEARQLELILRECYDDVVSCLPAAEVQAFSNFRGDSWQFVVGSPPMVLRVTLLFRALLLTKSNQLFSRKLQTSAALGFGSINFLPSDTSSSGGGKAYVRSGKRLDKLRRRIPGMGASGLGETDLYLDSLLGLLDALIHGWTALQAQAVSFALQDLSQIEIAQLWRPPISQQAVHKHLLSAGWPAIEPALAWSETTITGCINRNNS